MHIDLLTVKLEIGEEIYIATCPIFFISSPHDFEAPRPAYSNPKSIAFHMSAKHS